ncbi:hypothetical protein ACIA5D_36440 [Actinoplanes sp. NPDC051513]|uniref:hypothetical protein n=1 Tax=Actinoplanes sp. NPDC051513 TaxID=3363908 RepID=UPI003796EF1E
MPFSKGDLIVLTRVVEGQPIGAPGRVIRVNVPWGGLSAAKYTVLLDNGVAIEGLKEDDLFLDEENGDDDD